MQCQGQANFIPLFAKISTWLQAHWRMFVSFSDIELEFVLSSMLIPKRFSFFFQLTIMLNLGNWSFFVRFFSLVGIASMLQHNFLVTLLFSPNFASHVWAIKSVDFRLAQLGACWFFPLQCFPPGWASPVPFPSLMTACAAAAFAKFSANRSPNLWMPINLIDFHHTFSSFISSLPNDLYDMFYECQITKSRKCTLCIELPQS